MALIIKPDETTAVKKRIHFAIYDINGLITDHEAFGLSLAWAVDTFAPAASDLKVGADNGASSNYGGTFAYRKNGEWYYEFSNAEVAASLGADTVYIEFYRTGYRSFVIRIPLRNDVESIKTDTIDASAIAAAAITSAKFATDAIDANALKADAVTEIQSGLATSSALTAAQTDITTLLGRLSAARAGYLDNLSAGAVALASALTTAQTDLTTIVGRLTAARAGYLDNLSAGAAALETTAQAIKAKTDNLPASPADETLIIAATNALATAIAGVQSDTDDIQTRLPAALVGGKMDSTDSVAQAAITAAQADITRNLGLLHDNAVVDNQTYTGTDLTAFRLRKFANAAAAAAAVTGHANGVDGETERYQATIGYASAGKPNRFQMVRQL